MFDQHFFGLMVALLSGLLLSLSLLLARLRHSSHDRSVTSLALIVGLVVLLAGVGARMLLARTVAPQDNGRARAQQSFHRWTQQAIPLIVRYRAALHAASRLSRRLTARPADALARRFERTRLRLRRLEPPIHRLVAATPSDLRQFIPLLIRALTLAGAAERKYAAALLQDARGPGLTRSGTSARALVQQGNYLLRRSQQAIVAFTVYVNLTGGELFNG